MLAGCILSCSVMNWRVVLQKVSKYVRCIGCHGTGASGIAIMAKWKIVQHINIWAKRDVGVTQLRSEKKKADKTLVPCFSPILSPVLSPIFYFEVKSSPPFDEFHQLSAMQAILHYLLIPPFWIFAISRSRSNSVSPAAIFSIFFVTSSTPFILFSKMREIPAQYR